MDRKYWMAVLVLLTTVLSACGGANGNDEHQDDGDSHGAAEDRVHLDPTQIADAGIKIDVARIGSIPEILELPAEVRIDADRVARISPTVDGQVIALLAGEGEHVREGQPLAVLNSRELAGLQAEYMTAATEEDLAQARYAREQVLWRDRITSEADLQSARAATSAATSARKAAENRLHAVGVSDAVLEGLANVEDGVLAQADVIAPLAGTIIERTVSLGETVRADADDTAMFTIVDDRVLWVDIAIYKADLERIHRGLPVSMVSGSGTTVATSTIETVLPVISEASRTATARVVVDNSRGAMKPGQFVTAHIELPVARSVIRVPEKAIVTVDGRPSVFVPDSDAFVARRVVIGKTGGGFAEITDGLAEGDTFVSHGAFTLKAELENAAFGDGHGH